MIEQHEKRRGERYEYLIRSRTDTDYEEFGVGRVKHPFHADNKLAELIPAGTILVNLLLNVSGREDDSCMRDASGGYYKHFGCNGVGNANGGWRSRAIDILKKTDHRCLFLAQMTARTGARGGSGTTTSAWTNRWTSAAPWASRRM